MKAKTIVLAIGVLLTTIIVAHPATFSVINTNAGGVGSLLDAVLSVNASSGPPHRIQFAIPPFDGTVKTILITNTFPVITNVVVIDGYSQTGSSSNTLTNADNAVLLVEVISTNSFTAFDIAAGSSTVRGLALNGLGICVSLTGAKGGNLVEGNFIGLTASGTNVGATVGVDGVNIVNTNNLIGGTSPGARNVISGNNSFGILINAPSASNNVIQGNFIGTDRSGTNAIGNATGIEDNSGGVTVIGGTNVASRNIVCASSANGIIINSGASKGKLVQGNFIGVDVTGTKSLGNASLGISVSGGASNRIGGVTATPGQPPGNVISANGQQAIRLFGASGHIIQGNLIGTDVTGMLGLGNALDGILNQASDTVIGGHGINLGAGTAHRNVIQGNWIGTDISGTLNVSNSGDGIRISSAINSTTIGGTVGNIIGFNGGNGVGI